MTEEEWDDEFSQKITDLTGEIWTGRYDLKGLQTLENKIFAVIRKDRKHQQSKTLKRLSEIKIQNTIDIWIHKNGLGYYNKIPTFKEYNKLAKAIHKLVTDKLKEEK